MRRRHVFSLALFSMLGCGSDSGGSTDDAGPPGPVRILALGDSLTLGFGSGEEGEGSEGGYRLGLAERLSADGIAFDFVGSRQNGPARLIDRDHEGYNGYAVAQIAEITNVAIDAYAPDVILLLAGTNDQITFVPPSQPPEGAAADLRALLAQIEARRPDVQVIVGQVIPLTHNAEGVRAYNALLPGVIEGARSEGMNVRLVDLYAIGEESLSSDGIHPTVEGYDRMAEIWYAALREVLAGR